MLLRFFKNHYGYALGTCFYIMSIIISFILLFDVIGEITKSLAFAFIVTLLGIIVFVIRKRIFSELWHSINRLYAMFINIKIRLLQKYYYNKIIDDYRMLTYKRIDFTNMDNKMAKKFDSLVFSYICYGTYKLNDISAIYLDCLKDNNSHSFGRAILYSRLQNNKIKTSNYDEIINTIATEIFRDGTVEEFINNVHMHLNYNKNKKIDKETIKQNFFNDLPPEYQLGIMI